MTHESHLMLVLQVVDVHRETSSSPNKLEILLLLLFCERFEDSPEASNDSVIIAAVRETSDRPESFDINNLFTTGTIFDLFPIKQRQNVDLTLENFVKAFSESCDLLFCFIETCLQDKSDELIHVFLCHCLFSSSWA